MTRTSKGSLLSVAFVCLFAVACGGGEKKVEEPAGMTSDPTPTAKVKDDDFGEKVTAYAKAMIKILEANKGDCSALGEKLNAYFSENQAFLKKMVKSTDSIEAKSWKDENLELVEQLNGSSKILTGKCKGDSGVQEFAKSMSELGG